MPKETGRQEEMTLEEVFALSFLIIIGIALIFVDKLWR